MAAVRPRYGWLIHLPNTLTAIRFALAVVFPFLPVYWQPAAITVAILTEFFDGYTARRFNAVTHFGQAFDPIADKLFILSAVLTLVMSGRLALWQLLLIAMRDIVVSLGSFFVLVLAGRLALKKLHPRKLGKLTTGLQFLLVVLLFALPERSLAIALLYLTAVLSCVSAIDYLEVGYDRVFQSDMPL